MKKINHRSHHRVLESVYSRKSICDLFLVIHLEDAEPKTRENLSFPKMKWVKRKLIQNFQLDKVNNLSFSCFVVKLFLQLCWCYQWVVFITQKQDFLTRWLHPLNRPSKKVSFKKKSIKQIQIFSNVSWRIWQISNTQ